MTPDNPPFCRARQSETNSAFNIPAIVVAFLAPLLVWKLFDMWGQSALGFLLCGGYWWRMVCVFMNRGSARLGGSKDSASSAGRWDVSWSLFNLWVFFGGFFSSLLEQFVQWRIWRDSCQKGRTMRVFTSYICVTLLYIVHMCVYVWTLLDDSHTSEESFPLWDCTVRCSTLQHSLSLVGWLL